MQDETRFPEPRSFKPERWLDESGQLKDSSAFPVDPFAVVFGYGRRICPGVAFARSSLWMYMSTILSSCDIRMKVDVDTLEPIVPAVAFQGDQIMRYGHSHPSGRCWLLNTATSTSVACPSRSSAISSHGLGTEKGGYRDTSNIGETWTRRSLAVVSPDGDPHCDGCDSVFYIMSVIYT